MARDEVAAARAARQEASTKARAERDAARDAARAELHYMPEHRPEPYADDRKRGVEAVEAMAARLERVERKLDEVAELLKGRGEADPS